MKIIPNLLIAIATIGTLSAQSPGLEKSTERDWAEVVALAAASRTSDGAQRAPTPTLNGQSQATLSARLVADIARGFIDRNPNHLNAGDARKLEVLSALQGVSDADPQFEAKAALLAGAFRADRRNSVADRFEVALLAERVAARSGLGGSPFGSVSRELEAIAKRLRSEFGEISQVFNFYVSVARGADMATARRIAQEVLRSPSGREARAEAQSILNRDLLLNKSANWSLTPVGGKQVLALRTAGRTTLIVVWSPSAVSLALSTLTVVQRLLPAEAQVVYLACGGTAEQFEAQRRTATVPGAFCRSTDGANGAFLEAFQPRQTPYAVVIDRRGSVAGFGPLSTVPALLQAADR